MTVTHNRRDWAPLWLLSPAGLVLAVVTLAPIGFLIFTSFTDYNQRTLFTGVYSGVGFAQYSELLGSGAFWISLLRTVIFTVAMVAGSVLIGMGVSHLLTRLGRAWRHTVTVVLIVAWAMPNVASSLVWNWMFQPGYGVINWLLGQLRIFGDTTGLNWSQDPALAYVSIWLLIVWQAVPFIALTLNAAETQVPPEYQEAARLDGAGELAVYRMITLQHLRPTLLLITILSVIWDYNVFNQIWLVSRGGPGDATSTLGVFTYKTAFVGFRIGQGAAISVVTTLLLLGLTAFYIRNLLKSGEDL
ncbi:sugar ABC transporter permease [Winogradskya consettensis]|uniref:Sugar ABC transporter permease n=1 Tax=Winogradskya consettensis TaxID=113560 RepID=A0A919T5J7_9ACTN|nr:sugar ABC transporter permease [Actinoplanes consettensis]GIM85149.1 sugar ABC transporter permease [Actinoplanes consettensis]